MNILPRDKQIRVISALTEGCSIRATARLTDVDRETVMYLGVRVGEGCHRVADAWMRNLQVGVIELDEQWAFIQKKAKRVQSSDPAEYGDVYLFIALDATSKAVLSYAVGKRSVENTHALAGDLRARVLNRPQITSDGWPVYPDAIDFAFGDDVDFATIVKNYAVTQGNEAAVRYSPGSIRTTERKVWKGDPDRAHISTSYVERFNLTTRMASRRFARLTNAFSRKLVNHRAAVGLHIAHYNFCRVHETVRCTPAMALGVTDHIWTVGELIEAARSTPTPPPLATPTRPKGMSAGDAKDYRREVIGRPLRVIKGGRA